LRSGETCEPQAHIHNWQQASLTCMSVCSASKFAKCKVCSARLT
jgi:hypothetical protein